MSENKSSNKIFDIRNIGKMSAKDKILTVIAVMQIFAVLSVLILSVLKPANDVNMPLTSYSIYGDTECVASASDESILLKNPEGDKKVTVGGGEFELPFGAYQLVMDYKCGQSDFTDDRGIVAVSAVYGADRTAELFDIKEEHIKDGHPFWIDNIRGKSPIGFEIIYSGRADFEIYDISIKENTAYRYVCIMILAILFIIADIIIAAVLSKGKNTKLVAAAVIILITYISAIPLFSPGIHLKHDDLFHLNRIWFVAKELKAGNFPVRMMNGLVNGYGYPNSIFYCDIFLYMPALLCCMGVSLQTAYKLYIIAVSALTAALAYKCFDIISKNKYISLFGSAIYTLCGYRLINIYLRGALGEYTAMAFFPLVIMGMYLIYTKEEFTYRQWLPLALGMSGIIMSHVLSVEISLIFLVIFCMVTLKKTFSKKRIAALLKAVVFTVLISLWFIVPFFEYYITQPIMVGERFKLIQSTGLSLRQFFNVFVSAIPYENGSATRGLDLSIGMTMITGVILSAFYIFKNAEWKNNKEISRTTAKKLLLLSVIALCFASNKFPWDFLQTAAGEKVGQIIGTVQFSWRYLAVASATITVLTVVVLSQLKKSKPKPVKYISLTLTMITLVSTGYFYNDLKTVNSVWNHYSMTYSYVKYVGEAEYLLAGTDKNDSYDNTATVHSGNAEVGDLYKDSCNTYISCTNRGSEPALISVPVYNYKYYQAADIQSGEEISISNSDKNRVGLNVPPGYSGTIEVKYCPPLHWHIAEIISLVTLLATAVFLLWKKFLNKNNI